MSAANARRERPPEIDLARLPSLPLGELHELWRAHFRTSKPPPKRRLLVRELAYHVQSPRLGGIDADTRRRLDAAVRAAKQAIAKIDATDSEDPASATDRGALDAASGESASPRAARRERPAPRPVPRPTAPTLSAAATLVRVWNGRRHEVTVVEGGRAFVYQGTTYRSLTAVARAITGTEWSGPRFFGLAANSGGPGKQEKS
ncbi:MAG: DUF2924 domain-containing protein [Phycisphaerales bacterium]